ncbi:MAG: hypothetical protein M1816_004971 [Peltula sp. TS41687]|nr:MAG: hypothetical protein M1816_004971 [Peltula sp. TS41687]
MPRAPMRWMLQEDEILRREAIAQLNQGGIKDWNRIAAQLPGRNNKDCRKRWYNKVAGGLRKGPWQPEEDSRLKEAIREHGQRYRDVQSRAFTRSEVITDSFRWTIVAPLVGTRSAEQCAKRWIHSLDPTLDHSEWTPEEDQCLLNAAEAHGRSWKDIQRVHYPGRSRDSIKNRYTILGRKAENLALSADSAPCCPQVMDKSGWTSTPEDSSTGTGLGSEAMTPLDGNPISSPGEDLQDSFPLSRGMSHTQSYSNFFEHQYPTQSVQTPGQLTDSSAPFTMSPMMSSVGRSGPASLAPSQIFETGDFDTGLFPDQAFSFFDAWSTSPSIKGNDLPLFPDGSSSVEGMTAATWISPPEHHPDLVGMYTDGLAHMTSHQPAPIDPYSHSRIQLTMERPTLETTNGVVELLLKAGAKVSMRADANSAVTLNLENVTTETLNAVMGILFRTRTKIHMEAN